MKYSAPRHPNIRNKGSILILVLLVIASMAILTSGLTYRVRIEIKTTKCHIDNLQSYYLALGGIERIKAQLASEKEINAEFKKFLITAGLTTRNFVLPANRASL